MLHITFNKLARRCMENMGPADLWGRVKKAQHVLKLVAESVSTT